MGRLSPSRSFKETSLYEDEDENEDEDCKTRLHNTIAEVGLSVAYLNDKITEAGASATYLRPKKRHRFKRDINNEATHDAQ